MLYCINKNKKPDVLIITPLFKNDIISDKTLNIIQDNNIKIDWFSFTGIENPYKNFNNALQLYKKNFNLPNYIIKIDNDIIAKLNMLYDMKKTLDNSNSNVAYTYCSFNFTGYINLKIKAIPFNPHKLGKSNYISSISMMKSDCLEKIGGVVTDDKYFRLLDWALWLKFLNNGYIGSVTDTSFTAYASENSISNRGFKDYKEKALRVIEDFYVPYRLNNL
jgi:hypothetical protein